MRRRLLNLLTVLSLVLCVAVVALWVRSFWRYDLAGYEAGGVAGVIGSYRGHVLWGAAGTRDEPGGNGGQGKRSGFRHDSGEVDFLSEGIWDDLRTRAWWNVGGFSYTSDAWTSRVVITPSWFVALLLAALPARQLWLLRTRRRRGRLGQCGRCGYDLRATPERCPECGWGSE